MSEDNDVIVDGIPLKTSRAIRKQEGLKIDPVVSRKIDCERYCAIPLMSNGTVGPMLEMRDLFQRFLSETGGV